jgi:hypothetical protein
MIQGWIIDVTVIKTAKYTMDITVIKAIIDKADMDVSDNTVITAMNDIKTSQTSKHQEH